MASMFLYWGSGSNPSWKTMIALHEKGFHGKYDHKLCSFDKNEHKSDEILRLNPRGQVPTFKDGDIIINESMAIIDYLERRYKHQGTQLIPDDPLVMALVLQRKEEINYNFLQSLFPMLKYLWMTKVEDRDKEYVETMMGKSVAELVIWENYVDKPGEFLVGDSFTMADIQLIVPLAILVSFGCKLLHFPCLRKYYYNMIQRPSVKETWPPVWKETQQGKITSELLDDPKFAKFVKS